jgi:hypothetical protein
MRLSGAFLFLPTNLPAINFVEVGTERILALVNLDLYLSKLDTIWSGLNRAPFHINQFFCVKIFL